jgi:ribosome-binding protein aMBF1 (putative translation factor)
MEELQKSWMLRIKATGIHKQALAQDLKITSSYLSRILKCENIPAERLATDIDKIIQCYEKTKAQIKKNIFVV